MTMKRYKPEQVVTLLRQVELEIANGKTTPQACKKAEITVQTYYRWRKEFGGLKLHCAAQCCSPWVPVRRIQITVRRFLRSILLMAGSDDIVTPRGVSHGLSQDLARAVRGHPHDS
jgi:hypothetical protein